MKKTLLTILSVFVSLSFANAQESGTYMYETIYLTPNLSKISDLNAGLTAHNKKYHGPGDYYAFVQTVVTGRKSGDYVWLMGPGNFGRLDSRPAEGGHDDDWNTNVLPYLSKISNAEYWVRDDKAFYTPEGFSGDKARIRGHKIKDGKNGQFGELMAKIANVYKTKKYDRSFSLYWNNFPTAYGRNAATVNGFSDWAMFDKDGTFSKDFDSINGAGSFEKWITELRSISEWTDNEVRQNVPGLSSSDN